MIKKYIPSVKKTQKKCLFLVKSLYVRKPLNLLEIGKTHCLTYLNTYYKTKGDLQNENQVFFTCLIIINDNRCGNLGAESACRAWQHCLKHLVIAPKYHYRGKIPQ
jgi:hypothetical protein